MSSSPAAIPEPFTAEHVQEWASFGPKLKGKPTPEQLKASQERKVKCGDMKKRLCESFNDPKTWTEKKIEKELDRLVEEMNSLSTTGAGGSVQRPAFLDGPSGTRDFYPKDLAVRNWLFGHMRTTARMFGFREYDAPVLEHVELYERKAGEEIVGQMYAFKDQEGAHVTLRPEMTPTLARMVLNITNLQTGEIRGGGASASSSGDGRGQKAAEAAPEENAIGIHEPLPLKWFSIPQCWRFETTQRGRKREHYQWNMDIVGVNHVHAEVELLAAACDFFKRVGITPDIVGIKINSRKVLEVILAKHGIAKKDSTDGNEEDIFAKACVIIDKLDKIGGAAVIELLGGIGVSMESATSILKALEAKTIDELGELIGNVNDPSIEEVKKVFTLAKSYGFYDYLIFDASVVRGLAYYTGLVWEAFDRRGQLRAIMGGGRYDRLLQLYGGNKCQIPCVGFGFGDCVIMELLAECNKLPTTKELLSEFLTVDYVVCAYNEDIYNDAANISHQLRLLGNRVDLMLLPKKKVANSFKHADIIGSQRMVFVAPDEISKGVVRIKDLRTKDTETGEGIQIDCPIDQLNTIDQLILQKQQQQS